MSNELNGPESTTSSMKDMIDQSNKNEKKMFKEIVESQIKTQVAKSSKDNKEKNEKEMISIPKEEYDSLNNRITYLTGLIRQTKGQMINMQDALTMVQKIVLDSKQTMRL